MDNLTPRMRFSAIMFFLFATTSCSLSKLAPLGGAVAGGAVGGIAGPAGAGVGAGIGYGAGKLYDLSSENSDLVDAITAGDVEAIAAAHMKGKLAEHGSAFERFASGVKTVLYVAGALLLAYLAIPFIYTKRCLKKERETRAPFPAKPTTGENK